MDSCFLVVLCIDIVLIGVLMGGECSWSMFMALVVNAIVELHPNGSNRLIRQPSEAAVHPALSCLGDGIIVD